MLKETIEIIVKNRKVIGAFVVGAVIAKNGKAVVGGTVNAAKKAAKATAKGAKFAANQTAKGAKWTAGKTVKGAKATYDGAAKAAKATGSVIGKIFKKAEAPKTEEAKA
jgi:hypothetical protein